MASRHPIRVAIIGLTTKERSWAARAHLPYLLASPYYDIWGICNSTLESGQNAVKAFKLPPNTKAYSSIADLARDPGVELVVVCTRVDTHYDITKSLFEHQAQTGLKTDVFVEWPLGANLEQGRELACIARQAHDGGGDGRGIKTLLGLQARMDPVVMKIKEIIASGRIGQVLSVDVRATAPNVKVEMEQRLYYLADRRTGGNMLTIRVMHILDPLFFVHGEPVGLRAVLGNQIPYVLIKNEDGTGFKRLEKDTPDQVILSGRLASVPSSSSSTSTTQQQSPPQPVFSFHMRGGQSFGDEPQLVWSVFGDKGQMRITCEDAFIQMSFPFTVRILDAKTQLIETVDMTNHGPEESFWNDLPCESWSIGRIYEANALGEDQKVPDWDLAVRRHELVQEIYDMGGI